MDLMVNPVITDFRQDVNGDIKMLKLGANKEDAYANIIEQGGSAKLDNNKTATINVSTYTEPVVITPTSGKDGMKKATVTLSNIPSSNSVTFYAWTASGLITDDIFYTLSATPSVGDYVFQEAERGDIAIEFGTSGTITSIGEDTITFTLADTPTTVTRTSDSDLTVTKAPVTP